MAEFAVSVTVTIDNLLDMPNEILAQRLAFVRGEFHRAIVGYAENYPDVGVVVSDDHSEEIIGELLEAIRRIVSPDGRWGDYKLALECMRKYSPPSEAQ